MSDIEIFYRYDNRYRDILTDDDLENLFQGTVISANIALYYHNSITSFLENFSKSFFFDPLTYFLNDSPERIRKKDGNIRRSYKAIIEKFLNLNNGQINEYLNRNEEFIPLDINDEELRSFVTNVIKFQREFIETSDLGGFLDEYSEFFDVPIEIRKPKFLVSPYFRIDTIEKYNLNKRCIDIANDLMDDDDPPLCGCFTLTKRFLLQNPNIEVKILRDFPFLNHFIIWISDYDAKKAVPKKLNRFKNIVRTLSNDGINKVYNLYGDYFSLLLTKFGLTGICSGFGTSTKKRAKMTRGSPAGITKRIYLPHINIALLEESFKRFTEANPNLICNCTECQEITESLVKDSPQFIQNYLNLLKVDKNYIRHFLINRAQEKNFIENSSLELIIEDLRNKNENFSHIPVAKHLNNWMNDI